jgi:LPS export ABC transporter protein LptC
VQQVHVPSFLTLRLFVRPFLAGSLGLVVFSKIVIFSPTDLETEIEHLERPQLSPVDLLHTLKGPTTILAPGIPDDKIPDYHIIGFNYISSHQGKKDWKLSASETFFYNLSKLAHSKKINALLYDSQEEATKISGLEAKYLTNGRELEVFGNVIAEFPDGFIVKSEYMKYLPNEKKLFVPEDKAVEGYGKAENHKKIQFKSFGMLYSMDHNTIELPRQVHFLMVREGPPDPKQIGVPDKNAVDSDHCLIDRNQKLATFTMNAQRPDHERFVLTQQNNLFVKSRKTDLLYGDYSKIFNYMTAREDVLIKEQNKEGIMRTATGGRADFDTHKNVIILTEYPQIYQDKDTVTGEKITLYRESDIVEVEQSNAYSEGND